MPDDFADCQFSRVAAGSLRLHALEAGPADGPLVFLLHGFPEFWYGWRRQIRPLVAAGYRVVVPDQRGYNLSDKPRGVAAYDLDQVSGDILALADHFGRERFSVVGHDWGASVGWWLATYHAERLQRLAALNAPHPAVWRDAIRNHPVQKKKSAYVQFFRLPWLPEMLIRRHNFAGLADAIQATARAGTVTSDDLARYRAAWSQPGALTAMLNWYRALLARQMPPPGELRVSVPTLLIWGGQEAYAIPDLADASIALCEDGRLVVLDDATHWSQHDEPQRVNELLLEFLDAVKRGVG